MAPAKTAAELAVEIGAAAGAPPEAIARMAEVAELVAGAGHDQGKMNRRMAALGRLVRSWGAFEGMEKALPIAVTVLAAAALVVREATRGTVLEPAQAELWKQLTTMVGEQVLASKETPDG